MSEDSPAPELEKPTISEKPERFTPEKLERLGFAWCRIATAALLLQQFTLPVAAALSAGLFVAAFLKGKTDTQCWFRHPLIAAGFWILVLGIWIGWFFFRR